MSRIKFVAFAVASVLLSILVMVGGLLAVDLYIHHRAERSAGLNRWGYRGPVVGRKQPGETRVAMLGGSTTFGYGVTWDEAVPALLERELNQRAPERRWSVVNLGYNNEGAFALLPTLEDFGDLEFDAAIFYVGYNDLAGELQPNLAVFRHASPIFRLTGYFPLLPSWLEEKAYSIRYGGDLNAGYAAARGVQPKTVFRPGVAARTSAAALETAASVGEAVGRQLDRLATPAAAPSTSEAGCATPWTHFCDSVHRAVLAALNRGIEVLVADQPRAVSDDRRSLHATQSSALSAMIAARFGGNPGVRFVDLSGAVDLSDERLSFDQMHLNVQGNRVIAAALVEPLLSVHP